MRRSLFRGRPASHAVGCVGIVFALFSGLSGCESKPATSPAKESVTATTGTLPVRKFDFKPKPPSDRASSRSTAVNFPVFSDVAEDLGIHHVYNNGASPKALMVESTGGGCGWIDYDRDGRQDLYLSQGGPPCLAQGETRPPAVLYRQVDAHQFVECAAPAHAVNDGYGQGIAVGDFDNDGFDDLFVANVGRNRLLHNQGDGTFADVTAALEGLGAVWSSSPAWGDVDRDGDLDLYVCNYVKYDPCHPQECLDKDGTPAICHPRNVDPEADWFFVNHGDGRFTEASQQLGLHGPGNKALGVVIADLTGDDWPDIYVANDTTANFLFVNDGTGHAFKESALLLGGAYSAIGEAQASMGVGFGDYDNNGFPDLVLTHFTGEHNTLYRNLGPQGLQDVSAITGLRGPSLSKLGFGIVMADFNLDRHMDIFVTNGHIDPRYADGEGYEMTPQCFSFDGMHWQESHVSGDFFARKAVGRGVGSADYDADGDLDLCVAHQNSPAAILRNDSPPAKALRFAFLGRASNRNAFQTKVRLKSARGEQVQELAGGTSYAAAHERLLYFGVGDDPGPWTVTVRWPSGLVEEFETSETRELVLLVEGTRSSDR